MRILVTGGAGFLGSHLVEMLIGEGHDVSVVDTLRSGRRENLKARVRFFETDIRAPLDQIFLAVQPDILLHLAAQVSVPDSMQNPALDLDINVAGTINLIETAVRFKVKKLVTISSAAVYGVPQHLPLSEEISGVPLSPYGLSKLAGEHYVRLLCSNHDLPYTILRPANIYGPGQRSEGEGAVVPAFLTRFLAKQDPVIHGDGSQTRDFVYVEDMARAVRCAMTRADGLTLNVSSGTAVSVFQLWSAIARTLGWERPPVFGPHRSGDIPHSVMANSEAVRHLQWLPRVSLEDGVARTIAWAIRHQAAISKD